MKQMLMLGLLVIMVGYSGCARKKITAIPDERTTVGRVDLRDVIVQTGQVSAIVNVDLKTEASGRINRIAVKEGQLLNKGDTILTIDPTRLITQKQKGDLEIKRLVIQKQLAQRDYDNTAAMLELGTVSVNKLQDLKSQVDLSDIALAQQQLDLADINDQLSKTVIRAPLRGVLTNLLVKEGEIAVSATSGFQSGTAIGTIGDFDHLEVISQIGEIDYVHLRLGQKALIKPEAVEGAQTNGTISFISLAAKKVNNDELGSFEVRIAVDSLITGVAPGINVNVEFLILEKNKVIGVPRAYITKLGPGQGTVLVAKKDKSGKETQETRTVTLGATDYKNTEIVAGLAEGETVIFKAPENENQDKQPKRPGGGARAKL
ncbi:MAG: efflux RND transporter periplasmic adaptor subunit [Chitinivibrionales bacterium]|nr:efflux RND transporter periplasmic adaptor subunit [Chitinivibrionales bacterium]